MNIELSPETQKIIERMLASGGYKNADEIISQGIELLQHSAEASEYKKWLNDEIQKGVDSAEQEGWVSPKELKKEMLAIIDSYKHGTAI
jgi:putative addiction module CopG family antidote